MLPAAMDAAIPASKRPRPTPWNARPLGSANHAARYKYEAGPPPVMDSPNLPRAARDKVTLATSVMQEAVRVQTWRTEGKVLFLLEHFFASKSCASSVYSEKDVRNKKAMYRPVAEFRDKWSA
jgi:hypothetical protein